MERKVVLAAFRASLLAIRNPRFFRTERGYQGQLLAELTQRLALPPEAVVEQEYQKSALKHGLTIRPDIIIHEPYDPERHANREQGNFAVAELKLHASAKQATEDFESLQRMLDQLRYRIAVFVNLSSDETHEALVPPQMKGRIALFAVRLRNENVELIEAHPG